MCLLRKRLWLATRGQYKSRHSKPGLVVTLRYTICQKSQYRVNGCARLTLAQKYIPVSFSAKKATKAQNLIKHRDEGVAELPAHLEVSCLLCPSVQQGWQPLCPSHPLPHIPLPLEHLAGTLAPRKTSFPVSLKCGNTLKRREKGVNK